MSAQFGKMARKRGKGDQKQKFVNKSFDDFVERKKLN